MESSDKTRFTFRSAGALFYLSAAFELLSINDGVLLFGSIRDGVVALTYHLAYILMFAIMGFGLWKGKRWGDKAVIVSTVLYTADRAQMLFSPGVLETYLWGEMGDYANSLLAGGGQIILQATIVAIVLFVGSWWAFAWYTYARRDYFRPNAE